MLATKLLKSPPQRAASAGVAALAAPNTTARRSLRMRIPCCGWSRSCHEQIARGRYFPRAAYGRLFSSWPGLSRPSTSLVQERRKSWMPGTSPGKTMENVTGKCRRASLAAVDLAAHDRDRLLINLGRIPGLDRREIRLARLIPGASAPAMRFQEIRGRSQRA